ncbi:hypothetical protein [Tetragenococcus halophilus]|uniref:hypothetical protein n=1 Tax=Tetragenococcus halophilus TaxID=51669 RepID=UPI000CCA7638|nr:hypothetical protein [Tetragenococcus halophilus]GBD59083.1 hypothetical protein TEHN0098T_1079 [Tetragenococcus halophilus subsp. halophilus]GMA45626.1 hypothetical protein GCM10025853_30830 [Tetragenococcus halophilus subsp. halophilus DSM 20339]
MQSIQIKRYIDHKPYTKGDWHKDDKEFYTWQEEDYQQELAYMKALEVLNKKGMKVPSHPVEAIKEGFEVSLYKELTAYVKGLESYVKGSIRKPTYEDLQDFLDGFMVLYVKGSWDYSTIGLGSDIKALGDCEHHLYKPLPKSFTDFNQPWIDRWTGKDRQYMHLYLFKDSHRSVREAQDGHKSFLSRFLGS